MSVEKVTEQDHQNETTHNVEFIEDVIPHNEENESKGTKEDSSLYREAVHWTHDYKVPLIHQVLRGPQRP